MGRKEVSGVESTPIKPRAIIQRLVLPERVELFEALFFGEDADLANQPFQALLGEATVTGTSMRDCYEMALEKPSPFAGRRANKQMSKELMQEGFTPKIVIPREFDQLLKDVFSPDLNSQKE